MGLLEEGDVDYGEAERDKEDEKAQPEEDDLVLHVVEVDRLWSENLQRAGIIRILCIVEIVEILNLDDEKDPCKAQANENSL